jgi:lipopolysaccharide transport system ATP-binding protein
MSSGRAENTPIISIQGLSKKFNSIHAKPRKDGIRDLFGKNKAHYEEADKRFHDGSFWALEDISVDIFRGETFGIIGQNGAGKSTLLKVLSQIYRPTEGSFYIDGRVSSLLEVGTGFHQDLTGRENIYFNGSLLGMKKREIDEKFQDIVAFSELESFIDTPIKHYSSGMRSKLGFSVAVNLDAEVMIIDEALAVGDVRFREKALKRMKESAFSGKTVLFVTHSMKFIEEACDRVLYLKDGKTMHIGDPKETIELYLKATNKSSAPATWEKDETKEVLDKRIVESSIQLSINGEPSDQLSVTYDDTVGVTLEYTTDMQSSSYRLGYSIFDGQNRRLWRQDKVCKSKGSNTVSFHIDTSILKPGEYTIAADAMIENGKWIINPKQTKASVGFTITSFRKDIINEKIEGIIKPPIKES